MSFIEILASNEFGSLFYAVSAIAVLTIIIIGYTRGVFKSIFARVLMRIIIMFTVFYLGYRFGTGYTGSTIAEHTDTDRWYVVWAAFHGIVSFSAILTAVYLFHKATSTFNAGQNHFHEHRKMTMLVVGLWVFLLASFLIV